MNRRRKKIDASAMKVMPERCRTCPFGGREPVELHPEALAQYTRNVVTLQSQHLCHSRNNKQICRGGRELLLRVLYAMKLIDAPTDEAFERKTREMLKLSTMEKL